MYTSTANTSWSASIALAVAATLLLSLAGCAASPASGDNAPVVRDSLPEVVASDQQLEELEGGVSEEEYRAAFDRFEACMVKAEQPLVGVEKDADIISFSMSAAAYDSGDYDRCYLSEFQRVDERWQFQNKDSSTATVTYQACLTAAGVPPKESSEEVWAQMIEAGIDPEKCALENGPEG